MRSYRFLTTWVLDCPRERAWAVLADCEAWPGWWRGVESVIELDPGDEQRVGSAYRITWRAPAVPYRVRFDFHVDEVDEPARMAGRARGALDGSGTWRLFASGDTCAVTFDWAVDTQPTWMRLADPVARPLFAESHDRLMRRGGEDLAGELGVRLLAAG